MFAIYLGQVLFDRLIYINQTVNLKCLDLSVSQTKPLSISRATFTKSRLPEHYLDHCRDRAEAQVAQARYMSSSMWTFALLRDSSDLHIYKDLYGERSKPEKKRKITVELQ